ncbi:restriction endonuclease subunit S [Hydrogenophaga sp. T2]|uniref:restriction endonuclease subunit S n=1 Tax=Hydrogenophaga sp. T2 TaxID=3132823 RepID=UPI003CFAB986
MLYAVKELAEVRAGHAFRGGVPVAERGNARVVQMRDICLDSGVNWAGVAATRLPATARAPEWLQNGDVLFAARGGRNYALCLSDVPERTLCAQYFFVLRRKSPAVVPEYLAWHINRAPGQRYLMGKAEGTDQLSIRRAVLEDMPVALPDTEQQWLLVNLARAAACERRRLESLIRLREQELDALAHQLQAVAQCPEPHP